ncbi:hypothetical protein [Helicobacter sp. 11S02629-2]|uniref:hypothetical protein n=1 Tax=Helicobacter sp. 11S02629-2 TaxID=1476195 RepID=UPI000BA6EAED|nr:hypothetical protein [Helicobacter sp. 11S02629-2]PAF44944.1 hypothetical protein BKH40_04460 [Helicobacter sp. 11S02629-2]
MKVLLINQNPIVEKLIKLACDKLGVELESMQEVPNSIQRESYFCAFIDGESVGSDTTKFLALKGNLKSCLLYSKGHGGKYDKDRFEKDIQKPFLPTEVLNIIEAWKPLDAEQIKELDKDKKDSEPKVDLVKEASTLASEPSLDDLSSDDLSSVSLPEDGDLSSLAEDDKKLSSLGDFDLDLDSLDKDDASHKDLKEPALKEGGLKDEKDLDSISDEVKDKPLIKDEASLEKLDDLKDMSARNEDLSEDMSLDLQTSLSSALGLDEPKDNKDLEHSDLSFDDLNFDDIYSANLDTASPKSEANLQDSMSIAPASLELENIELESIKPAPINLDTKIADIASTKEEKQSSKDYKEESKAEAKKVEVKEEENLQKDIQTFKDEEAIKEDDRSKQDEVLEDLEEDISEALDTLSNPKKEELMNNILDDKKAPSQKPKILDADTLNELNDMLKNDNLLSDASRDVEPKATLSNSTQSTTSQDKSKALNTKEEEEDLESLDELDLAEALGEAYERHEVPSQPEIVTSSEAKKDIKDKDSIKVESNKEALEVQSPILDENKADEGKVDEIRGEASKTDKKENKEDLVPSFEDAKEAANDTKDEKSSSEPSFEDEDFDTSLARPSVEEGIDSEDSDKKDTSEVAMDIEHKAANHEEDIKQALKESNSIKLEELTSANTDVLSSILRTLRSSEFRSSLGQSVQSIELKEDFSNNEVNINIKFLPKP